MTQPSKFNEILSDYHHEHATEASRRTAAVAAALEILNSSVVNNYSSASYTVDNVDISALADRIQNALNA